MVIYLRASSMPVATRCPQASVQLGVDRIGGDTSAADIGTAAHKVWSSWVKAGSPTSVGAIEPEELATAAGEDRHQFRRLCNWGWRQWQIYSHLFPQPSIAATGSYVDEDREIVLSGHMDVYSEGDGRRLGVVDAKTGRTDTDYAAQMKSYALIALVARPDAEECATLLLHWRSQIVEGEIYTRRQIMEWWRQFAEDLIANRNEYRIGDHCQHCKLAVRCPALTDVLGQTCSALVEQDGQPPDLSLGRFWDALKLVEAMCKRADQAIKARLADQEVIDLGDGRRLQFKDEHQTKILFTTDSYAVLANELEPTEITEAVAIRKSIVEKLIAEKAGRGQKGAAVQAFFQELERVDALAQKTVRKIEVIRREVTNGKATGAIADGDQAAAVEVGAASGD